jgi:phage baseplate assembly protein W
MGIKIRDYDFIKDITKDSHIYKDIKLDIDWSKSNSTLKVDQDILLREPVRAEDVLAIYDKDVIRTSLFNLFNTSRGQRFLFPEYGVNLNKYLFMPINEGTAKLLGDDIREAITKFEKRVKVLKVHVDMYIDTQTFEVTIALFCDILGDSLGYKLELSQLNKTQKIDVYSSGSF